MSLLEQHLASLYQLAVSFDGAVLGLALAYTAVRSFLDFRYTSNALGKVRNAPQLKVSDLRALLDEKQSQPSDQEKNSRLVIVRGQVEAKSAVDGMNWKNLMCSKDIYDSPTGTVSASSKSKLSFALECLSSAPGTPSPPQPLASATTKAPQLIRKFRHFLSLRPQTTIL